MFRSVVSKGRLLVLACALSLGAALVGGPVLAAGKRDADRKIEMQAREDFAAGRYAEALELFAKLYAETLHPVYLHNIGRCHQKMREPDKAIDAFHDYLAKSKNVSRDDRAMIEGYIAEMEKLRDEQAAKSETKTAPVPAAPSPAPTAAAGLAQVAPSPATSNVDINVAAAPSSPPTASLIAVAPASPAKETPVYARWWFWTGLGALVAGGVATALVLSSGTNRPACTVTACK
jgi:hypothetical protein